MLDTIGLQGRLPVIAGTLLLCGRVKPGDLGALCKGHRRGEAGRADIRPLAGPARDKAFAA